MGQLDVQQIVGHILLQNLTLSELLIACRRIGAHHRGGTSERFAVLNRDEAGLDGRSEEAGLSGLCSIAGDRRCAGWSRPEGL